MTSTPRRFLPYGRQQIGEDDVAAVTDVLRGDTLTTGPKVAAFEQAIAGATGASHAVTCSSGTEIVSITRTTSKPCLPLIGKETSPSARARSLR